MNEISRVTAESGVPLKERQFMASDPYELSAVRALLRRQKIKPLRQSLVVEVSDVTERSSSEKQARSVNLGANTRLSQ